MAHIHHAHDEGSVEKRRAGRLSTQVSVVVNLLLSTIQIVVGALAHSSALIADGVHSLSDLLADFVVLLAGKHSHKAPDHDHQYGHHRYENAASLALGLLLLGVGLGMLYAAAGKFSHPDTIPTVHTIALWIALLALVAKELLFRYMLAVAKRVRSSMLVANAWHARSDAASSLVVALGIVGNLMGYPLLDPVAALLVGLLVTRMGWRFGWDAMNDLMDRAADDDTIAAIRQTLLGTPGIYGVHDLRTRKMGDLILVDVHLEVDGSINVEQAHAISETARHRVLERHPVLDVLAHIDPAGHYLPGATPTH
ncbi:MULTISPECIES: cation diffusion facilitator family transporter [Chromobacterium]|uniref:Cation diffusion facilitator family transporter n=1 Tax=Chromobacterium aquaticum TaxID=467180 RepID=A0ABV8ZNI2_9NEIS|nr:MULTISPECIES: cation diffusion facilitator family transporter [Chromobacterium]KMN35961.1 cobalt transporter [Chromobacterium sp. LK1]MCD5364355.1 cation diffusion facilitator family transporter [Chromobacterium aquaticum]